MTDEAEQLKIEGMHLAEEAAEQTWVEKWDAAIVLFAARGEEFTAEHVRWVAGDPTDHPNAIGSRFNAAARTGLIRKVGWRASTRTSRHKNPLTVWIGVSK